MVHGIYIYLKPATILPTFNVIIICMVLVGFPNAPQNFFYCIIINSVFVLFECRHSVLLAPCLVDLLLGLCLNDMDDKSR